MGREKKRKVFIAREWSRKRTERRGARAGKKKGWTEKKKGVRRGKGGGRGRPRCRKVRDENYGGH